MAVENKSKNRVMPKLRFPEFRETPLWPVERLGSLFSERQETGFPDLPLLSVTDREGVIPQEETNRTNSSSADKSKYLRVVPGDIAYNTMRMWEGRSARVGLEGLVSPAYTVCRPEADTDSVFFAYYFKTQPLIAQFRRYSQGLVKDTLNLKYEAFSRIRVGFPEPAEQRKIAACLTTLDELVAAEGRKLEALRAYKKGLMEQLFPSLGESRPRLRFPEFRDDPDWREVTVGEVVNALSPPKKLQTTSYMPEGLYPIVDQSPAQYCGWTDDADAIITPRQPVVVFGDHTCTLKLVTCPFAQGADGIKILDPLPRVTGNFLFYALSARPLTSDQYKRHYTELKEMVFSLPSRDSGEQQRIAACLSSLDALIAAASWKLDSLRAHKRGLMQQLFPSQEGV